MVRNEGDRLRKVVVCSPRTEYFHVADLEEQHFHRTPDPARARDQHHRLTNLMRGFGCEVIDLPELAGHPNSVFTRDVALVTPEGYIKLRMGLRAREGEESWMAKALDGLNIPCVGEIEAPGTLEGGDIILAGRVAFLGLSDRTNREGAAQITEHLSRMKYDVRITALGGAALHLGGAMSMIAPDRVMYCKGIFPADFFAGFETIEVPAPDHPPTGCNVICLQKNEVIANKNDHVEAIRILRENGINVHDLDLSEFRKGAGGPSCLILPIQRGGQSLPDTET